MVNKVCQLLYPVQLNKVTREKNTQANILYKCLKSNLRIRYLIIKYLLRRASVRVWTLLLKEKPLHRFMVHEGKSITLDRTSETDVVLACPSQFIWGMIPIPSLSHPKNKLFLHWTNKKKPGNGLAPFISLSLYSRSEPNMRCYRPQKPIIWELSIIISVSYRGPAPTLAARNLVKIKKSLTTWGEKDL